MQIKCNECGLCVEISVNKIPEKGAYARCKKCKNRFFVKRPIKKPKFNVCPKCHLKHPLTHAVCCKCGLKFDTDSNNPLKNPSTTDGSNNSKGSCLNGPPSFGSKQEQKQRSNKTLIITVAAIILIFVSSGYFLLPHLLAGSEGLQVKKSTYTRADYEQNLVQWNKKYFFEDYQKHGKTSVKWDSNVRVFFDKYAVFLLAKHDELYDYELLTDVRQIINSGCNDPLIYYLYGNMTYRVHSPRKAEQIIINAFNRLEKSEYPALYKYTAARKLIYTYEKLRYDDDEELELLYEKKMRYLAQSVKEDCFKNSNRQFYVRHFLYEWTNCCDFPRAGDVFMDEYNKIKNIDPWIDAMIRGKYHIGVGWEARGSGYADTVSQDGWGTFQSELDRAGYYLTKAHDLHPEYPEAAALMISVQMAVPYDQRSEREWFRFAVNAQFDYMPAYNSYLWSLRPRWGGSHKKMIKFGTACLETERFDTDVPEYFLIALRDISGEQDPHEWNKPYHWMGIYRKVKKYFKGVLNEPSRESAYYKNMSSYVLHAWACGQYKDAKNKKNDLGDEFISEVSKFMSINPKEFVEDLSYR